MTATAPAATSSGVQIWLMAARIRTLPASLAPVLVGTALAGFYHVFHPLRFLAALLGAIFIQVGTNLSNDYSDARRGADTEDRLGPVRVTAGGLVPPQRVLVATYMSFGVAVLVGVYLIAVAGWVLLAIGAASILAGVLYTGGPRPYGYEGLGELFVFLFFGIVAVAGSLYVQVKHLPWEAFALAVPVGLLAAAILVVNNVRDIDTDRRAGKRTLAVRLGRRRTRVLFALMIYGAYVLAPVTWVFGPLTAWLLLPLLTLPPAAAVVRVVRNRVDGPSLNKALAQMRTAAIGVLRAPFGGPTAEPVSQQVTPLEAVLTAPFETSRGAIRSVSLELVQLTDDDGTVGHGETIDDARWDLAGRQAGEPVWRLLGAEDAPPVEVNATIASATRLAPERYTDFRCVKVKVGLGDDRARVESVREALGQEVAIRLDANGAWSVDEAIAALSALEPLGIELCEQPSEGVEACARVAESVAVPISLDESAPDALETRVCDAVCLKLARFGGISGLADAARRAREVGYRVYLASMLDGPLGIAAALHCAALIRPDYPCGLATLSLFEGRVDPLPASGGRIAIPDGPGLGDGLIGWYGAR